MTSRNIDAVNLNVFEFLSICQTTGDIIKENPAYFNEIFKTDEISLPVFALNVWDELTKMGTATIYSYNVFNKTLTITMLSGNDEVSLTASNPVHANQSFALLDDEKSRVGFDIEYHFKDEMQQMRWYAKINKTKKSSKQLGAYWAHAFWSINFYLKNLPEIVEEKKEKVEETYCEKKKGVKRYKTRIILKRVIHINTKKLKKSDIKHVIKCLCWGVRGHERHLKNGKVVWIKPFKKGKERNNENAYVTKEYIA